MKRKEYRSDIPSEITVREIEFTRVLSLLALTKRSMRSKRAGRTERRNCYFVFTVSVSHGESLISRTMVRAQLSELLVLSSFQSFLSPPPLVALELVRGVF